MENNKLRILDKLTPDNIRQHFSIPTGASSLTRNQNLACFLVFLIQVLDDEEPSFSNGQQHLYTLLQKKLTFLHAFLGDKPFQSSEKAINPIIKSIYSFASFLQCLFPGLAKNFWEEFESLANEARSFIYSFISASSEIQRNNNFDGGIHGFLENVETFIDGKIKEHCIKEFPKAATSRSNHLSSLYIVGSLLEGLQGLMNSRFDSSINDVKDQMTTLIEELTFMQAFLKDLQKSQVIHGNDELEDSLYHFIDATYEAEYLINAHTADLIPRWYLNLRLPIIVKKIQTISKSIKEVKDSNGPKVKKTETSRYNAEEDAGTIVGFEEKRAKYLADLVGGPTKLQIISIFGMPGIGKTTIAKKLYNDRTLSEHFVLRLWCTVSQTYDRKKVLDEIWQHLPSKSGKESHESLSERIYKTLFGRRYIIIMDDVWDSRVLDDLRKYLPDNGNGSRILLTSRIKRSAPTGSIFHSPSLLSNMQCYDLLTQKIFVNGHCPPELLDIAMGIASKCHGLPLTVIVVAGILANMEKEESKWKNVERNLDSYISDDSSMGILELSYKYLPHHLKPCFLCLRLFYRKDIPTRDLIPMWISQGFVLEDGNKSKEETAEEYVLELINRSLLFVLKRKSDGGIRSCELHDLIYDMCIRRVQTEKFYNNVDKYTSLMNMEHHHLTFSVEPCNIYNISALHSRSVSEWISALGHSVTHMPLLRVIKSQESPIEEKIMGALVHLMYFSSYLRVAELPKSICKLVNLEYLHLNSTHFKVHVPSTILKMVKLRQIRIGSQVIFSNPGDIAQIQSNIKSLSRVRIRNSGDEQILQCSTNLRKLKCICEGMFPDLISLTFLESLNLSIFDIPRLNGDLTKTNLPSMLKKVTLSGTNLRWEESSIVGRLPNLQVLKLLYNAFCGGEWETRDDQFQELRFLKINNIFSLRKWTTSSEHFPKLQHLMLDRVRVELPLDIGHISTLRTIEVLGHCGNVVYKSAAMIREEQLEYENQDLKIITQGWEKMEIVEPSTRGQDEEAIKSIDEVNSKFVEESSNLEEESGVRSPPQPDTSAPLSGIFKTCAGCNGEIHGRYTNDALGSYWHHECFCCHYCEQLIYDHKFKSDSNNHAYHMSCDKELSHPKCYVCRDFVPTDADGDYDYLINKLWDLEYCESHETDGIPKCCSCFRFEPIPEDGTYLTLDDGRALCLDCKDSLIIMNTEECRPLYMEILDFMEGCLDKKMKEAFPILVVDKQAMDEATEDEGWSSYLVYNSNKAGVEVSRRFVTLSITTTHDDKSKLINSILVLYGLPRIVLGDQIASRLMQAWMDLEGYQNLSLKVKVGMYQVLSYMWLEHETASISRNTGKPSEFEKNLCEYCKYMIENNSDADHKDGFWEGEKAVDKYGMKHTLDHIRHTGTFPI